MKNRIILISLLSALLMISSGTPEKETDHNAVPGKIILRFQDAAQQEHAVSELKEAFSDAGLMPEKCLSHDLGIWLFSYDQDACKGEDMLMQLRSDKRIHLAQFDHYITQRDKLANDPSFAMQWALYNIGQSGGVFDADIDATKAWEIEVNTGTSVLGDTIIIAVVDDGFDLDHEDMDFWKNHNEIPGNGIDDDSNGYVDDYDGWNAYSGTGNVSSGSHGTRVAGVAGAVGNNEIGISGIGWNCKVMPVSGSSTFESTVVAAYAYVYKMRSLYEETNGEKGAFVVVTNSSFGVDLASPEDYPIWGMMYDSLGSMGILNAAATTNNPYNIEEVGDVPTGFDKPHLISVTNTTDDDIRYTNAAWGPVSIDLGAPGTNIISTRIGSSYGYTTGTSMASPQLAGSIALLFAAAGEDFLQQYNDDPAETSLFLKNLILDAVDTLTGFDTLCVSGGRLNVDKAVRALLSPRMEASTDTLHVYLGLDTTAPKSVVLSNLVGFELAYYCNFLTVPEWISYFPSAAYLPEYGHANMSIGFRTAGLAFGTYYSTLEIRDQGGWLIPLVLELNVIPNMGIAVNVAHRPGNIRAYPNPFSSSLTLEVDSPDTGEMMMHIYSLSGMLVKTKIHYAGQAGMQELRWDGSDASGKPAPPGIYVIQVSGNDFGGQLKVVRSAN